MSGTKARQSPTKLERWSGILYDIRKESGLTRTQLSNASGIAPSTIENYEMEKIGQPSIYKVEILLKAMGYDLDALKQPINPGHDAS